MSSRLPITLCAISLTFAVACGADATGDSLAPAGLGNEPDDQEGEGDPGGDTDPGEETEEGEVEVQQPALLDCTSGFSMPALAEEGWNRWTTSIITLGSPNHSALDVMVAPDEPAVVEGKFTYGITSKDLEDEKIEFWLGDCDGGASLVDWNYTDRDGRVQFVIDPGVLPSPGVYPVWLRVTGDNSGAPSTLRILPPQTKLVVFDIDGTLTTDDAEVWQDAFSELFNPFGDYVPEALPGARDAVNLRAAQGYTIVYLTGRPYWLTQITRQWLDEMGFAPGHLRLTGSNWESLPTEAMVGEYKAFTLLGLLGSGFEVSAAYGNATTDIWAYDQARVRKHSTYVVGKHGGEEGTVDLGDDYLSHLSEIIGEGEIEQPFAP